MLVGKSYTRNDSFRVAEDCQRQPGFIPVWFYTSNARWQELNSTQSQFELLKTAKASLFYMSKSSTRNNCSSSCSRLLKPVCSGTSKACLQELHSKRFQFELLQTAKASLFSWEQCSFREELHSTQFQFELLKTARASLFLHQQMSLVRATLETSSVRVAQDCSSQSEFTRAMLVGKSYTRHNFSASCLGLLKQVWLYTSNARWPELHSTQFQFEWFETAKASLFLYEQCSLVRAPLETIAVRVAQDC